MGVEIWLSGMARALLHPPAAMDDRLRESVRQVRELLERLRSEASMGARDEVVADLRLLLPEVRRLRIETWGEPLPRPTWDEILPRPLVAIDRQTATSGQPTRLHKLLD